MASSLGRTGLCSLCQPATLRASQLSMKCLPCKMVVSCPGSRHPYQRWRPTACHAADSRRDDNQAAAQVAESSPSHETGHLSREQLHLAASYLTRRSLASYIAAGALLVLTANDNAESARAEVSSTLESAQLELISYTDEDGGFSLLRPASWTKVDKAGATVLFEDPARKSSTIGVVVNPVRIPSLREFGSLEVVAQKLIAAERKKESTKAATLIRTSSREAQGGVPLYTLEYALSSTRGNKRTLTAVTISGNKLYILNIAYADSETEPALPSIADPLHQVLESFDLVI